MGLLEAIRQTMLEEDRKAKANAHSVVLDSHLLGSRLKKNDFTIWGEQFAKKDPSKREVTPYDAKKTVVQNYEDAAKKAGQKGTLIVSVGHGADQGSCSSKSCQIPDPSIGSIDLTPDGKVKVDSELMDYINRGEMEKRSDDSLLKNRYHHHHCCVPVIK